MKHDPDTNHLTFETTGRVYHTYSDLLSTDGKDAYFGYDGALDDTDEPLTPAERAELADHMIALWRAFKAARSSAPPQPT